MRQFKISKLLVALGVLLAVIWISPIVGYVVAHVSTPVLVTDGTGRFTVVVHLGSATALLLLVRFATREKRLSVLGFQGFLVLSTLTWLWHYQWVVETGAGGGLSEGWAGLRTFTWVSPLLVYGALFVALWLATRPLWYAPFIAAGLPATIFLLTWFVTLPLLRQGAPSVRYVVDNMPGIWLFFHSAVATGLLCVWALRMKMFGQKAS